MLADFRRIFLALPRPSLACMSNWITGSDGILFPFTVAKPTLARNVSTNPQRLRFML